MKSKVALAVAIALAILAAVGIKAYITGKERQITGKSKTVEILVAAKDIPAGAVVEGDMVVAKEVPQEAVVSGLTILATDINRGVVGFQILQAAKAGQPILWSFFGARSERSLPSAGLASGYRQIAIPVDKVTGCAGRLIPGTVVDVLATLRVRRTPNAPVEPVTQTVLTGMTVVATDLYEAAPYRYMTSTQRRDMAAYSTVTLRALPHQAALLAFLADQAKLHLVIRAPDDASWKNPREIDKVSLDNLDGIVEGRRREAPQVK